MTHGLRPQAGWDPVESVAVIEAKAQELAGIAARMKGALLAGNTALVRDRLPVAQAAHGHVTSHLVLLKHALGVGAGER